MKKTYSFYVSLGFTKVSRVGLVGKGRNHVTMMTGNPNYPTPTPTLVAVTAACDTLDSANNAYEFNKGKLEREACDVAFNTLKNLIKDLGSYVQMASNGDKEMILSAGFDVRKANEPIGELQAPQNVRALVTLYPGRIIVKWDGVRGRAGYQPFISSTDPTDPKGWMPLTYTTKNRIVVEDLVSNTVYHFKVLAQGPAGASPVSDVASAKAV